MRQARPTRQAQSAKPKGFLGKLRRNQSGNVMFMMAIGVVPLIAMVGGSVDVSRLYMARTRLQQACDAGALAARRSMASNTALSATDQNIGYKFFDFNYPTAIFGSTGITRNYAAGAAAGTVNGTASVTVPTTLMQFFGYASYPISVSCQSTLNIPNTDVMFVLDVTGSMAQIPAGDTISKMDGLKGAVKDFYAALGPGKPTGAGRIRYGFVPYASNVNVGKILKLYNTNYVAGANGTENVNYTSRTAQTVVDNYAVNTWNAESAQSYGSASNSTPSFGASYTNNGSAVGGFAASYSTDTSASNCSARSVPADADVPASAGSTNGPNYVSQTADPTYPANSQTRTYTSTQPRVMRHYRYGGWVTPAKICYLQYTDAPYTRTTPSTTNRTVATWLQRNKFVQWNYGQRAIDTSQFTQGVTLSGSNRVAPTVTSPTYFTEYWDGTGSNPNLSYDPYNNVNLTTPSTLTWQGCIEEAQSDNSITTGSSIAPSPMPSDLNIDLVPNSAATRWKPYLPELTYATTANNFIEATGWMDSPALLGAGFSICPAEASRLGQYTADVDATSHVSTSFASYVDSLQPVGGTYHDIGMVWGARFLSQDGIFSTENSNSAAPGGYPTGRHIVFMTDGTLDTREYSYDAWGMNYINGRVRPTNADTTAMNAAHKRRLEILCNSMKGKGFTIWVVGFGIATLPSELTACATDSDHASVASNSNALKARFQAIAQSIGGLRLAQ